MKRTPEYAKAWEDLDENYLHRGQIEKLLKASIFKDFSKIYQFANPEQRKFLDLYSFQSIDKLIHSRACCQSVQIELGMSAKKITVR